MNKQMNAGIQILRPSICQADGRMDEFVVCLSVRPTYRSQNRSENCVLWLVVYKVYRSISGRLRVSYELKWMLWCKFFREHRKYRRGIIEVEELISVDACVHNNFWKQKCGRSL